MTIGTTFIPEFDQWVRTEGDCNRASAISSLNRYDQEFSELGNRVRELSQASYLRPSSDLLAEAVEREGAALRSLASTWAPYESDVYRGWTKKGPTPTSCAGWQASASRNSWNGTACSNRLLLPAGHRGFRQAPQDDTKPAPDS